MALVLTRKEGERIVIGDDITVEVGAIVGDGKVRLLIEAPRDVVVDREEVHERKRTEGRR